MGELVSCMFKADVEYDTIAEIKQRIDIPVFANGDIKTPQQAAVVLEKTGADGVMIGRGALGQPWLFTAINSWLNKKLLPNPPSIIEQRDIILNHLKALHELYGSNTGVRVARKHLSWYCQHIEGAAEFKYSFVRLNSAEDQLQITFDFFDRCQSTEAAADLAASRHGELGSWYQARKSPPTRKQSRRRLENRARQNSPKFS